MCFLILITDLNPNYEVGKKIRKQFFPLTPGLLKPDRKMPTRGNAENYHPGLVDSGSTFPKQLAPISPIFHDCFSTCFPVPSNENVLHAVTLLFKIWCTSSSMTSRVLVFRISKLLLATIFYISFIIMCCRYRMTYDSGEMSLSKFSSKSSDFSFCTCRYLQKYSLSPFQKQSGLICLN